MVKDAVRENVKLLSTIAFILVLPLILKLLFITFDSIGLGPYLVYQLYYLPLGSWLEKSFFNHDSELGILVLPLGAITTAIFYALIIAAARRLFIWFKRKMEARRARL